MTMSFLDRRGLARAEADVWKALVGVDFVDATSVVKSKIGSLG